jgi:hypothetical protein
MVSKIAVSIIVINGGYDYRGIYSLCGYNGFYCYYCYYWLNHLKTNLNKKIEQKNFNEKK